MRLAKLIAISALLYLAGCGGSGGGGGGGGGGGPPAAPSGLSYPSPPAFDVNSAITPLMPTVSGMVTSYSVSPALPAGLTLNATSGVISGTPTTVTAQAPYTITATNAGESTTTKVSIVVVTSNSTAPAVSYRSLFYTFTVGVAAQTITPYNQPGSPSSWSVAPALPAGLSLNPTTGEITGTPTVAASAATYTVTALSSQGLSAGTVMIAVTASAMFDLGHGSNVATVAFANSRVLSEDSNGHWVLWNYSTGQNLASGGVDSSSSAPVALAGSTVVIQVATGLEVRRAADGSVQAKIATTPSWWQLASDGSYICAGTALGITAWSPAGVVLFTRAGDYSKAVAFATAAQIQVALGAAGSTVIETITVPAGASTTGPTFNGQFQSWFADGNRFFTAVGTTVWVYSSTSVEQDVASLSTLRGLGGQGSWFLIVSDLGTFTLYAVGSGGQSALSESLGVGVAVPAPSANLVGLLAQLPNGLLTDSQITVLNLSGAAPVTTTYTSPVPSLTAYAATSTSAWVVGNHWGVLLDGASLPGPLHYLGYGAATGISGGTTNVVVATASGRILYFDAVTHALQGTIDANAQTVMVSSDGTVLAAEAGGGSLYFENSTDKTITIYSLPGGTAVASFPFTMSSGLVSMTLSGSGTALGEVFDATSLPDPPCSAQVISVPDGASVWCPSYVGVGGHVAIGQLQFSPDGTMFAVSPPSPNASVSIPPPSSTANVYQNGKLISAVPGWAEGWPDNGSLLTFSYTPIPGTNSYANTTSLYSATGQLVRTLPNSPSLLGSIQPLSSTTVYSSMTNAVYSLTTGATIWESGSPAAINGNNFLK
jgi:hypothetical protein